MSVVLKKPESQISQSQKYDVTRKIMECLADIQSRSILFSVIKQGKTAEEIAYKSRIPLSTVYKKIRDLEELTLVQIERRGISEKGRKFKIYRSRISKASIKLQNLKPKISLSPNKHLNN